MDLSFGAKGNLWMVNRDTLLDLGKVVSIDRNRDTNEGGVVVKLSNGEMMTIPGASGEALWMRAGSLCLNQSQFSKKADNA